MSESYPLVIGGAAASMHDFTEFKDCEPVFFMQNNRLIHPKEVGYNFRSFLISSILRKPRNLLTHMQRITLCYEQEDEEQLYAAIVDFFIVLENAGLPIRRRLLAGCKNRLSLLLMQRLQFYLNDFKLIEGNMHSVLTSGIQENLQLVLTIDSNEAAFEHDPLQIARDYIEYSQLDEARETLETAILITPDYTELHEDLIELYRLTNNFDAFNEMKFALSEISHPMQKQWDDLNSYFTQ